MVKLHGCFHVASWKNSIVIKVEGFATLNNSLFFHDFVDEMLREGFFDFIIDLSSCKGMDSTFMGVLVGVLNFKKTMLREPEKYDFFCDPYVTIVNANTYHHKLLDGLGISQVLSIKTTPVKLPDVEMRTLKEERYDPQKRMKMIQEAHCHLMKLNAKNEKEFGQFLKLLEEELK